MGWELAAHICFLCRFIYWAGGKVLLALQGFFYPYNIYWDSTTESPHWPNSLAFPLLHILCYYNTYHTLLSLLPSSILHFRET